MKYDIKKNWMASFGMMVKNPSVLMPFVIIAFLETLALELIYFSTRKPILLFSGPIIKKFFGEPFLHYPANLILLPKILYLMQVVIYIVFGTFLTAITVNIFRNIKGGLPVKINALVRNASKRYFALMAFGAVIAVIVFLVQKADFFVFLKSMKIVAKVLPQLPIKAYDAVFIVSRFLINMILQALFVLAIPIMIMGKKPLFKSLMQSFYLCVRNFPVIISLIFLPLLIYFPITLIKSFSSQLTVRTFPEIILLVNLTSSLASIFIDCFIVLCAAQFLIDKDNSLLNK